MLVLGCLVAAFSGCDPPAADRLVIATSWPASDRRRIESEFDGWLKGHPEISTRGTIRLEWLILSPGDDPERLVARRSPPDVLLGGPARAFERLGRAKRLSALPIDGSPTWAVARRGAIRLITARVSGAEEDPVTDAGGVAFDDPRKDPISLTWAAAQLEDRSFPEGYARLVRAAGEGGCLGRLAGSA